MKQRNYISLILCFIFVVAFAGRLSVSFMCSCGEHHHDHAHEHICCHCPEHDAECSNHDFTLKDNSCKFHFAVEESIAQVSSLELKRAISPEVATLILAYIIFDNLDVEYCTSHSYLHSQNQFASSLWSGAPSSLRAPPVLV